MAAVKLSRWDSAEYLETEEDIAAYLEAALEIVQEENDPAFFVKALGVIARARGMSQMARDTGISRDGLYKALSDEGNPSFGTILRVTRALGLQLHVAQAHPA